MLGPDELAIQAIWDDAQLTLKEAEAHVDSLIKIIEWMTQPENWTAPVGQLLKKN